MQDRPSALELLAAAREHLETAVVPTLSNAKVRYQTLVALHVLAVVEREIALGEGALRDELASLRTLQGALEGAAVGAGEGAGVGPSDAGGVPQTLDGAREEVLVRTRALCASIRRGDAGPGPAEHVRRVILAKLRIANPAYKSLRAAPPAPGKPRP